MKIALFLLILSSCLSNSWAQTSETTKPCAILLHGLGRTSWSMWKLENALKKRDYVVWNEGYPSTDDRIENLAPVIDDALLFCQQQNAKDIYFVTHSMGGILLRYYYQNKPAESVKAAVMLAPPNHGSEIVDAYKDDLWFQWVTGIAGLQLGTSPESLPNQLAPIAMNIGVIAGIANNEPWFANLFSGPSDGKVSVESAKLAEMKDFITVEAGHTFIMNSDVAIEQIFYFFENGTFKK